MKVKEGFNMDQCLDVLQKQFIDCKVKKKSDIYEREYIDVQKSFLVGARILYKKKKGKLLINTQPSVIFALFGILFALFSINIVSEVKDIMIDNFEDKPI
jgi:hypothetical protein